MTDPVPSTAPHRWVRPGGGVDDEARWGHPGGLQLGLQPLLGPRGLLRIFAPYLGHPAERLVNFVAIEPIVDGASERGFSELETSALDGVRGKRFWTTDEFDGEETTGEVPPPPARGVVEVVGGIERLTFVVHSEAFENGARVSVRVRFRADRPHEVALAAFTRPGSAPLAYCVLTATMGNFARLRRLHLRDRVVTPAELWPGFGGDHFADHARFAVSDLVRTADGGVQVVATPDEPRPHEAHYASDTAEHWKYFGSLAAQGWRVDDPDPALEVLVNARAAYWASSSPIPGGPSFENFEIVQPFVQGQEATFWIEALRGGRGTRGDPGPALTACQNEPVTTTTAGTGPSSSTDGDHVVALLRSELGDRVSSVPAELETARSDKSGHVSAARPIAVVHVASIDDVRTAMSIAHRTGTPVVVRGAGTGLAGGAIASGGELVLSTLGMDRLLEVSVDDELAVVEPGIINADLNAQLAPHGLWFAPDPASRAISTVGGNIATNAGGLLCAKYGVTRDAVLGLKVVLADGRLLTLGHRTVKGVTGLDLTSLMIGSEGTLGVIVEATVKLRPVQRGVIPTISAQFPNEDAAARAAAVIVSSGLHPSIMELIGDSAMAGIAAHLGMDHPGGSQLIVQTDGPGAELEAQSVLAVITSLGGVAQLSVDPEEGERLFAVRRAFHPAMSALGTVLIEDVCVPRSQLPAMFGAIGEIEAKYGITIPTVAHAGDGNLHPNFIIPGPPGGNEEVPEHIWAAADELFLTALRLGGTLTGEHGVGILKRRWLRDELGDDQLELQRQIKAVFDPTGILNPGKVFESGVDGSAGTSGNTGQSVHARR